MPSISLKPSLAEFRELAKQGNLIPVCTELIADAETPVSAFQKMDDGGSCFLLESVEKSDQAGRYSFVGSHPRLTFESRGRQIRITENGQVREYTTEGDPLRELEALMGRYRFVHSPAAGESRFLGGAVGYLSYDMVRFFEPTIAPPPKDELGLPEMLFLIADSVLIFDHRTRRLRIVSNAFVETDEVEAAYAKAEQSIRRIADRLARTDKHLREHTTGRPITDPAERAKAVHAICADFFTTVLPELVRQGIVVWDRDQAVGNAL